MNEQAKKEFVDGMIELAKRIEKKHNMQPILITSIVHDQFDKCYVLSNHDSMEVALMMVVNALGDEDFEVMGEA